MDEEFLKKLAKEGSETDIKYYNKKSGENVFTFLLPFKFPERIAPLLLASSVSDVAMVQVNQIDRDLGEVFLAIDAFGIDNGIILADTDKFSTIKGIIKNTTLSNFEIVENKLENAMDFLERLKPRQGNGEGYIVVDQVFPVKGVGTVALGFVKGGRINKHDEMRIYPGQKMTEIRSIQVQDVDVDFADMGTRVGVALKNVEPDNVPKGAILASHERFMTSSSIKIRVRRNPAIRDSMYTNEKIQIYSNFGKYPATVSDVSGEIVLIDLEQEIAITQDMYVISHQDKVPRIFGGGKAIS
ncbi:MAG: EF-Tu/IF-2/RF-3 family GTPase [Thermoplasmata archaeon]